MTESKDNNGFHVKLEGLELSNDARERVQAGIQAVVLRELAAYKPNPDDNGKPSRHLGGGVVIVPPKQWWGFIVRQLTLPDLEKIPGLKEVVNAKY